MESSQKESKIYSLDFFRYTPSKFLENTLSGALSSKNSYISIGGFDYNCDLFGTNRDQRGDK